MKVDILLVSSLRTFREALKLAIKSFSDSRYVFDPIREAESRSQTIEIVQQFNPDIVVIVIEDRDGAELIRIIQKLNPMIKILVLAAVDRSVLVFEALNTGINGFILKKEGLDEFQRAMKSVVQGDNYFSGQTARFLAKNYDFNRRSPGTVKADLTKRELEVLKLVVAGKTSKDIARQLDISYHTVAEHRKRIKKKLGVKSSIQLAYYMKNEVI